MMASERETIDKLIGVTIIYVSVVNTAAVLTQMLHDPIWQLLASITLLLFGILLATGKIKLLGRNNNGEVARFLYRR